MLVSLVAQLAQLAQLARHGTVHSALCCFGILLAFPWKMRCLCDAWISLILRGSTFYGEIRRFADTTNEWFFRVQQVGYAVERVYLLALSVLMGHTCADSTCVPLALTTSFRSVMPAAMSGRATFWKRLPMMGGGTPCISMVSDSALL